MKTGIAVSLRQIFGIETASLPENGLRSHVRVPNIDISWEEKRWEASDYFLATDHDSSGAHEINSSAHHHDLMLQLVAY